MKKFVFPENKSVIDFRVMEEEAMEPGPGGGACTAGTVGRLRISNNFINSI